MKRVLLLAGLAPLLLAGCDEGAPKSIEVKMMNAAGDEVGTAEVSQQPAGMQIKINAKGFEPGPHGFHIHEVGTCKAPDFSSAGNHFNPEGKEHGLLNPKGAENGDLPNLVADEQGVIKAEILAPNASLNEGKSTIRRKNGAALIITADPDDGMSQPTGKSGKRLACGVIVQKSTAYNKEKK
ncbi:superoxide dismutase family protein [Ectobacillus ponti]|uniref:Superoxide dismutase family protein n=1 Tax=Ectobacillus ponti TaxID=2961894 RepID=A0AA41XCZ3_9BACI|nr:superoxide dismutase family protein [Ectobacillus ponti]MCP8969811.1 superoxide dismutase family protein [Ectobacillus ponti]